MSGQDMVKRCTETVNIRANIQHDSLFTDCGALRPGSLAFPLLLIQSQSFFRFIKPLTGFHTGNRAHGCRSVLTDVVRSIVLRRSIASAESHLDSSVLSQSECDVKINQTNVTTGTKHDIGRLDVSMKYSMGRTFMEIA